jgi:predicted lysophospholipase L1 biosynthesis ABC-type transport system permease subunit
MLALVALLTGGFLVYSAQSLSVMRGGLSQFALLRTLGMRKRSIEGQLLAEGTVLGLAGSACGLLLGYGSPRWACASSAAILAAAISAAPLRSSSSRPPRHCCSSRSASRPR